MLTFYSLPHPLTSQNFQLGLCFVYAHPIPFAANIIVQYTVCVGTVKKWYYYYSSLDNDILDVYGQKP